jgi:16S rRNA processing protein RimM
LRGDVVIAPLTNRVERFAVGSTLFADDTPLEIVTSRKQGVRFVVRFVGIDDRTAAEAMRGRTLSADPIDSDDPDELFVHELIGARMTDQFGRDLGVVTHVEANPAHDIAVCDSGVLVPVVFIRDRVDDVISAELPDGLVELYLGE